MITIKTNLPIPLQELPAELPDGQSTSVSSSQLLSPQVSSIAGGSSSSNSNTLFTPHMVFASSMDALNTRDKELVGVQLAAVYRVLNATLKDCDFPND